MAYWVWCTSRYWTTIIVWNRLTNGAHDCPSRSICGGASVSGLATIGSDTKGTNRAQQAASLFGFG